MEQDLQYSDKPSWIWPEKLTLTYTA